MANRKTWSCGEHAYSGRPSLWTRPQQQAHTKPPDQWVSATEERDAFDSVRCEARTTAPGTKTACRSCLPRCSAAARGHAGGRTEPWTAVHVEHRWLACLLAVQASMDTTGHDAPKRYAPHTTTTRTAPGGHTVSTFWPASVSNATTAMACRNGLATVLPLEDPAVPTAACSCSPCVGRAASVGTDAAPTSGAAVGGGSGGGAGVVSVATALVASPQGAGAVHASDCNCGR